MEEKKTRDVTEALDLFDRLTDDQKQDALERMREKVNKTKGAACRLRPFCVGLTTKPDDCLGRYICRWFAFQCCS